LADEHQESVLGGDHPARVRTACELYLLRTALGRSEQMMDMLAEAMGSFMALHHSMRSSLLFARTRRLLGLGLLDGGSYDTPLEWLTEAGEARRHVLGEKHPQTARDWAEQGALLIREGKFDEARERLERAEEAQLEASIEWHPDAAAVLVSQAELEAAQGNA